MEVEVEGEAETEEAGRRRGRRGRGEEATQARRQRVPARPGLVTCPRLCATKFQRPAAAKNM